MKRILALAGSKQSGKNTCCNFLHGYQLMCYNVINGFSLTKDGELYIEATNVDESGHDSQTKGVIDITREDLEFADWAAFSVWPFIKHYSFASTLKGIAVGLFGLTEEQVYGTDEQKNSLTQIKWNNMPGTTKNKKGYMSAREFLQHFGSNICRQINPDIWTDRTLLEIQTEEPNLAVISDCRFPNEAEAVKKAGGKVIHLTRQPYEDSHISETALNGYNDYDAVIDNSELDIMETNGELLKVINDWGWLGEAESMHQEPPTIEPLHGGIVPIKK